MGLQRVRHDWATNTSSLHTITINTLIYRGFLIKFLRKIAPPQIEICSSSVIIQVVLPSVLPSQIHICTQKQTAPSSLCLVLWILVSRIRKLEDGRQVMFWPFCFCRHSQVWRVNIESYDWRHLKLKSIFPPPCSFYICS